MTYGRHEYEVVPCRVCNQATELLDILVVELITNPHHLLESLSSLVSASTLRRKKPSYLPAELYRLGADPESAAQRRSARRNNLVEAS
jgi:hypothetical protein